LDFLVSEGANPDFFCNILNLCAVEKRG
jgi:hypothetical protein